VLRPSPSDCARLWMIPSQLFFALSRSRASRNLHSLGTFAYRAPTETSSLYRNLNRPEVLPELIPCHITLSAFLLFNGSFLSCLEKGFYSYYLLVIVGFIITSLSWFTSSADYWHLQYCVELNFAIRLFFATPLRFYRHFLLGLLVRYSAFRRRFASASS
jgi:hypothetical protein